MKQPKAQNEKEKKGDAKPEPFDLWLKRGLNQIYDDVTSEPIPEDLLRLIEEDRKK